MLTQGPENDSLSKSVSKEELHNVLLACGNEQILGLDGWGVELYINLFELMSFELLAMTEKSRVKGYITGTINATFITLIPNNNLPITFKDYHPISLYNSDFQMISKIISYSLKTYLFSPEKFGFPNGRHVQDVVTIV